MSWLKLIHPILVLGSLVWLYAKRGWRAGYVLPDTGDAFIEHDGRPLAVREQRSKIGWPIWAVVEIPAAGRWRFHLRTQTRLRLRREVDAGIPEFDAAFWIDPDSDMLLRALCEREALLAHLMALRRLLERERSALSRIVGEDGTLCVELNVRWIRDRPRLYRLVLAWLVELDRLLNGDARPPRAPTRRRINSPTAPAAGHPRGAPP